MAIIQGSSADVATVESTLKAVRVSIKPDDALGFYHVSSSTGAITTLAAGGPIFSFRYAPGLGQLCVIKRVSISFVATTGFTAGQQMGFGMYVARSFLTSDTGGTTILLANNNQKNNTRQVTSGVVDARISTTAVLTAGTRTLDAQALGLAHFHAATTTAGTLLQPTNLISYNLNDHPLVLQNNEGFVITNQILMGAAGVGTAVVNVEWFETDAYKASGAN
jgi:hypothetical protein